MTFDPVAEPDAYRRSLLTLLGDDDPAVVQASTPAAARALVAEAGDMLRIAPAPGEWSVIECLGHMVDGEVVTAGRFRWIIAEDTPDLPGYDQALWVPALHHVEADPDILLGQFEGLRAANLDLWARLPVRDRARYGIHRERGPESYELLFRLLAGHDRNHMQQARDALATVTGSASASSHAT